MAQDPVENIDSLSSIESIKDKRRLLKQVVMISRATERMQDSLKSVLILGQPSTSIPKGLLKYYHVLSNKIKQKPTEKISWYLKKLEELIQRNLDGIISITMLDYDVSMSGQMSGQDEEGYTDDAMNLLNEFKRQSQTAVALKILLQQRGVQTSGTSIKIPIREIEGHIRRLEIREEIQRKQIKTHIKEMQEDLGYMLNSDQYSDEMKKVFRKVMANLEDDLNAIDQGTRIDQLSLSFEVVETGEKERCGQDEAQQEIVSETEEYLEEFDQGELADAVTKRMGFFRTLLKWLNTPWSVSWEDVKRGKD